MPMEHAARPASLKLVFSERLVALGLLTLAPVVS
jgi:hypothetical protein